MKVELVVKKSLEKSQSIIRLAYIHIGAHIVGGISSTHKNVEGKKKKEFAGQ